MRRVEIDLREFSSKESLHKKLAEKLKFPSYYGKNLDALYDCLTDINEQTELVIHGCNDAKKEFGRYANNLILVLSDAAKNSDNFSVIFK